MADTAGERRNPINVVSELDYREIARKGQLTEEKLDIIKPYLDELRQAIHDKWESIGLLEGQTAKALHYELKAVVKLQKEMERSVIKGKQAKKKLEEINGK